MISQIANVTAAALCTKGKIGKEDMPLYTYGFYVLYSYVLYLAVVLALGAALHILLENLTFFACFTLLRSYAGGFHAKTERRCLQLSMFVLIVSAFALKQMRRASCVEAITVCMLIGYGFILCLCPVEAPEKCLTVDERKSYRRIALIASTILVLFSFIAIKLQYLYLLHTVAISFFVEAFSLLLGWASKKINSL